MSNSEPRTTRIIDFDNYDPFGTNAPTRDHDNITPASSTANNISNSYTSGQPAQGFGGSIFNNGSGNEINSSTAETVDASQGTKGSTIFSLNYYKIFFDVQGDQVLQRAIGSFLPSKGHLEDKIKSSPDLYGPLWISVTLIVTSAVSHGIAQFIQDAPKCAAVDTDIRRTSFVATVVFLYTFLLPSALWVFLKYQGAETRQNLVSYMCLYGYSMAVFIPISIIWVTRLEIINWLIMTAGTAITAYALIMALWPSLQGLSNIQSRIIVALVVVLLHASLAISLGAYAFAPTIIEAANIAPAVIPIPTEVPPVPAVATAVTNSSVVLIGNMTASSH